jgi:hypothetical protein
MRSNNIWIVRTQQIIKNKNWKKTQKSQRDIKRGIGVVL